MSLRVAVVGGGVLGLLCARGALARGWTVRLLERERADRSPRAASWGGTRIVRDDPDAAGEPCTARWRRLIDALGGAIPVAAGVAHLDEGPTPLPGDADRPGVRLEADAFLVDTDAVHDALVAALAREPGFSLSRGEAAEAVDGAGVRVAGGGHVAADLVVVAAGPASGAILALSEGPERALRVQACALLRPESPHGAAGAFPAFVQHAADGVWGTPALGAHPAKITASDLCFPSIAAARRAIASDAVRARFLARAGRILPALSERDVLRWELGAYAEATRAEDARFIGRTIRARLACNGGGFRRAPAAADLLLTPPEDPDPKTSRPT